MVQQSETIPVQHVEFFTKVANIPVVHSAIEVASDVYTKAKDMSPTLLKKTWSAAEDTANFAARCALPMVQTIENNQVVHAVDQLACKTLDKVEETLPVMTKTPEQICTYVNDSIQPMSNTLTSATDVLFNNPLGRLALGSVQLYMSAVHGCIDYVLPPVGDEEEMAELKAAAVPVEPSQKILWSVRRSFGAVSKVQHRLFSRAQKVLHSLGMNGLLILGTFIDFVEWLQLNFKELLTAGPSAMINKVANSYRSASGVDPRAPNTLGDLIFLIGYLMNSIIDIIRGALHMVTHLADTQPVRALRVQLSTALAVSLDFVTRTIRIVTSKDVLNEVDKFVKTDYPRVNQALMMVKSWIPNANVKIHSE